MNDISTHELAQRIERLERRNRLLTGACVLCLSIPLLALAGWQSASDTLKVKRLEVIDDRGVPLVTLGAARNNEGGSIILRDKQGDKRGWWEVAPQQGAFAMTSSKADGTSDTTMGLQIGPKNGRLAIISGTGAMFSANLENDNPQLEMVNAKGNMVFAAPWKPLGKDGG